MTDTFLDRLQYADTDANDLSTIVNGSATENGTGYVTTRLGRQVPTILKAQQLANVDIANGMATETYADSRSKYIITTINSTSATLSNDGAPRFYRVSYDNCTLTLPTGIPPGSVFVIQAMKNNTVLSYTGRVLVPNERNNAYPNTYTLSKHETLSFFINDSGNLIMLNAKYNKGVFISTGTNRVSPKRENNFYIESGNIDNLTHTLPSEPQYGDKITYYAKRDCTIQVADTATQKIFDKHNGGLLKNNITLPRRHGITLWYNDISNRWHELEKTFFPLSGTRWREEHDGTVTMWSQSSVVNANSSVNIPLPVALANTDYTLTVSMRGTSTNNANNIPLQLAISSWTNSSFAVFNAGPANRGFTWILTGGRLPN